MSAKTPTLYRDDGSETELPCKWEICGSCEGSGTTSRHVECDGGGFTSSEWAEQDDDFKEDYLAGRYDRSCDECSGLGRVKVADLDRLSAEDRAAYERQCDELAEMYACERAERMMGA